MKSRFTGRLIVLFLSCVSLQQAAARAAEGPPAGSDASRQEAFNQVEVIFQTTVFSGERFPACDLNIPRAVKPLLGAYTLKNTFYDAQYTAVTSAAKPGRYGCVTEITPAGGTLSRRYTTLFRRPNDSAIPWWRLNATFEAKLPAELGIDPAIAREQSDIVSGHLTRLLGESLGRNSGTAAVLAALYEARPGIGKLPRREDPMTQEKRWWFGLKQKLGQATLYPYKSFLPDDYEKDTQAKWPLILFLHGMGECGTDLKKVDVHGPHKNAAARKQFLMIYPQCPPGEWWTPVQVNALLDEIVAKYRVDAQRIYLTGLSMGGYGTWDTSMSYPERFAAIVPICGAGDYADAARVKDIPAWVFHGGKDPVVPVVNTYDMVRALGRLHGRVRYTIYPDLQHDSWTVTYNNPELYTWMLAQKLGQPAQLRMEKIPQEIPGDK